jgi:hypothetical protein
MNLPKQSSADDGKFEAVVEYTVTIILKPGTYTLLEGLVNNILIALNEYLNLKYTRF